MLLVEDDKARMKYFDPYERSLLEPSPTIKENGKEVPTSKKDPSIRREEVLSYMSRSLVDMCIKNADSLLRSLPGSRVLKEVYANLSSEELVKSLAKACELGFEKCEDDNGEVFSLYEHPVGHRAVKSLILSDAQSENPQFAEAFIKCVGDRLTEVAMSNRGAFVVSALFKVPSLRSRVSESLKSIKKQLKQLSKEKTANAGFLALMKDISSC